jgi:hypothetical protein
LDHLADIDADYLAFYRVDLRDPDLDLDAETFFSRVFRLFNYRGAMRDALQAELQEEEKRGGPPPTDRHTPAPAAPQPTDSGGTKWVSPDEMKTLFPDLFQGG